MDDPFVGIRSVFLIFSDSINFFKGPLTPAPEIKLWLFEWYLGVCVCVCVCRGVGEGPWNIIE